MPAVFLILAGLAVGSQYVQRTASQDPTALKKVQDEAALLTQRRELIETLNHIVTYQYYHRAVYGHFSKLLNKVGYSLPPSVASIYEIRVTEATEETLLIHAVSEGDGGRGDVATVDQDYRVQANFTIPPPSASFLRSQALRHLRELQDAPPTRVVVEKSVYRGFFRYELREDSQGRKTAFAFGIKSPVAGVQIDAASGVVDADLVVQDPSSVPLRAGIQGADGILTAAEKAQEKFREEHGRYARNWSELSQVASFKLSGVASAAAKPSDDPAPESRIDRRPSQIVVEKIDNP